MKPAGQFTGALGAALAGCLLSGAAAAAPISVFSTDFESGLPPEFSGITTIVGTQGFSSHGFGSSMLRNADSGNPQAASTRLTLTGLQSHTSIDLNFVLGIINSWDGNGNPFADVFNVHVDGVSIFAESFAASGTNDSFAPEIGVTLIENGNLFDATGEPGNNPGFLDAAYDMGLQTSVFDNIAHTGATLTIDFFASGLGWSGSGDESFAIDNVEVILNGVALPEPSSLGMLGLGLAAFARRRRGRHS